ncbi:hypothetical protein SAMN05421813_10416 [Daejeonella rubra]|uniref:Lipoprotein n=1 Tax=Daejeonella rubra TaxID=990371 RepID=A0A1G9P8W0_9SPHI|nr:hypothetical protein [Daejeonella rubra]SDL94595.1 hypothetical protein SAMN05421813_10416 [Daejeonella rubra]
MNTAYRPLLAATFVLFLSMLSCSKDSMNGSGVAYFDIIFELSIGRTVIFAKDSKELTISMISVNDSRCPINANCVTAGNAIVKLRLSDNSGSEVFTELCLGQCENSGSDTKQITLSNISYSITIRKVEPYPKINDTQEKKVLFSVSKI